MVALFECILTYGLSQSPLRYRGVVTCLAIGRRRVYLHIDTDCRRQRINPTEPR